VWPTLKTIFAISWLQKQQQFCLFRSKQ